MHKKTARQQKPVALEVTATLTEAKVPKETAAVAAVVGSSASSSSIIVSGDHASILTVADQMHSALTFSKGDCCWGRDDAVGGDAMQAKDVGAHAVLKVIMHMSCVICRRTENNG